MKLPICTHCKTFATDPAIPFCDYCGEPLKCQELEEEAFTPLLLIAGIRDNLTLNHNTACRLFFRNFDAGSIRDLTVQLKSRTAREAWEERLPTIARGMDTDYIGVAEFLPAAAGDIVLVFILSFTDCRGARRRYQGELTMSIADPAGNSQQAHITFNVTNSKMMGNDLSDLIRIHGAERGDSNPPTVDGFRRIPIALRLTEFAPGQLQGAAGGRNFAAAGGRYRLEFEGREAGRRVLILTQSSVALGMKKYTTDPRVGLTLRLLPCRSEALDPENWQKTLCISSPHATVQARADHVAIRDEPGSKNGVYLGESGGKRPGAPARQLPKGDWQRLPERCEIFIGQQVLQLSAQTFCGERGGIEALRLGRVNNLPELEYLLAVRRVRIGSGAECAVRVGEPGFPAVAAMLEWNGARWTLTAAVDTPEVKLGGRTLHAGETAPVTAASRIQAGAYQWSFDAAVVEDFTEA